MRKDLLWLQLYNFLKKYQEAVVKAVANDVGKLVSTMLVSWLSTMREKKKKKKKNREPEKK